MSWYPERLLIANVAGRALMSDSYIIGELHCDPWKGFDIPEGVWCRVEGRVYEEQQRPEMAVKTKPPAAVAASFRRMLLRVPVPATRVYRDEIARIVMPGETKPRDLQVFVGPEGRIHVNPELLAALVKLIDGEPEEWRGSGPNRPVHAVSERGHWYGAIMPVRVP